jgi:hypothetical protein
MLGYLRVWAGDTMEYILSNYPIVPAMSVNTPDIVLRANTSSVNELTIFN